jgi:hypothetical protein
VTEPLRSAALAFALALLLPGCTQWHYSFGDALPEAYEDRAQGLGMAQVLTELGPPLRFAAGDQGLTMAWEAWRIRETSIGLSLGFMGMDALEFDWGDAKIRGDYLVLVFDRDHRVTAAARASRESDIGDGAALQPFAGFVSVVDVDDLLAPLPQHYWGAAQLLPLPSSLNNAQRPGMGDTGIEQRGTPLGAGQRSKEWED